MKVYNENSGPIDPGRLWQNSGNRRSATYVLPPIPRPQLLTQQLSGCDCHSSLGAPAGLAFVPIDGEIPFPDGSILSDIVPSAGLGTSSILNMVSLGATFIPGVGPAKLAKSAVPSAGQLRATQLQPSGSKLGGGYGEFADRFGV